MCRLLMAKVESQDRHDDHTANHTQRRAIPRKGYAAKRGACSACREGVCRGCDDEVLDSC